AALSIPSIAVGGTNPADFVKGTSTCGATLAAGVSCTTPVSFRPTAAGARSATLVVTDNAAGSPRSIPLTGTGATAPAVSIPTVTAKSPASGATGVALGSTTALPKITATFNQAVTGLPTTAASSANFTVKQ